MAAVKFKAQGVLGKAISRTKWILSSFIEQWENYGFKIACPSLIWWIGNYGRNSSISFFALRHLTAALDSYFEKKYKSIIESYTNADAQTVFNNAKSVDTTDYHIWVFWWQGKENMPVLVRSCYEQLVKHNDNVVLITNANIREYVNIPEDILDFVNKGRISLYNSYPAIVYPLTSIDWMRSSQ